MAKYIHRYKQGKGFFYKLGENKVTDKNDLDRIASLVIPPAWQEVKIAVNKNAKIQVEGRDTSGKKQYIYHPSHREKQEAAKFDRITNFAANLPKLRRQVSKDLERKRFDKRKVLACAVSLMDEAYFRVGNQQYAEQHQSYGLTTLRSKHVSIKGSTVTFDFIGKSGQHQHKEIEDKKIARIIKKLDDMPGYEIFRYYDKNGDLQDLTSLDVNNYIRDIMGDEYSAKDFRTWGGTLLAAMELAKLGRPEAKTERRKSITACVKRVAKKLGNTPAIARSSYIDPRIITMFEKSDGISDVYQTIEEMKPAKYLSNDEQCVVKLLSS